MNISVATAKRISQLLKEKDFTQYRLAKETCISGQALRDILHFRTKDINSSTVFLIASAFGLTMEQFYASPLFNPDNIEV